jgi:predicted MFS family arabinose efflux permease
VVSQSERRLSPRADGILPAVRWLPGTDALREREFRLLFIGQSVSVLGDGMSTVALAFAVLDIGGSASQLGLVLAAGALPFLVFLLIGGVVADRLPRRGVMLSADVVRVASQGTMAVLVISGHAQVWELAALQAVRGTASAFFGPASTGLIPHTVSPARLQEANALRGLASAIASIAGPALAGVLVAGAGAGWALAADAATFAVSAGALAAMRLAAPERVPGGRFLHDLRGGWHEFTARKWVWATVTILAFSNLLSTAFYVLGPVVADESLGGASAWALIVSAGSLGAFLGGLVVLRIKPRRPIFVGISFCALGAVPSALLAIPAAAWLIALSTLIAGGGVLIFNTLWETTLQQHIPPEALSRVSAYDWLGSFIANPIGLALVGPIAAAIGNQTTLLLASAGECAAIALTITMPSVRSVTAGVVAPAPASSGTAP